MSPLSLHDLLAETRALLLDVDDTIVDTRGAMVTAGTRAAATLWPHREAEHEAMAQRYYDDPQRWFPRYAAGDVPFDHMRAARLEEVATAFGLDVPDGGHVAYEEAYAPAFRAAQRLFPDVPELLSAAERHGLPVGLLTNSAQAPTTVKLEALGLADRFDVVVTTDTLGFGKPDPRVYLEACRLLDGEPHRVVCIGDSLAWDVLGAQAAGLRAVWLDREGRGTPEQVASVRSLREVTAALDGRFGPPSGDR
ncbi:HAD family hydrolase [Terrabacter sp. NPDC080008]|uniref:HAD family hydrolase n=1 Tax=Terrabacter sp. NPDC080008 TaxID=3155176 RepID=UPI00344D0B37